MVVPQNPLTNQVESANSGTYAKRGAGFGALFGLMLVAGIMYTIDPTAKAHSPIFPAAVLFVCVFACVLLLASISLGTVIGAFFAREADSTSVD